MKFVIITGLSGAGKSQAMKCMEDIGFYCADNLPPLLIPKFAELCFHSREDIEKIALVIDIRGGKFFEDLFEALDKIQQEGYEYEILFLEASDETLIKRFKETRRSHPLAPNGRLIEGIKEERKRLAELKKKAKHIVDTSNLTTAQLKEELKKIYVQGAQIENITILIQSFGFKKGISLDADLVLMFGFTQSVLCESLRDYTGEDERIRSRNGRRALNSDKLVDMIEFLPYYIKEGKSQLVILVVPVDHRWL